MTVLRLRCFCTTLMFHFSYLGFAPCFYPLLRFWSVLFVENADSCSDFFKTNELTEFGSLIS